MARKRLRRWCSRCHWPALPSDEDPGRCSRCFAPYNPPARDIPTDDDDDPTEAA